ncbi:MAG: hypothetical protein ACLPX9_20105 [Rhodomicrobium sp.]
MAKFGLFLLFLPAAMLAAGLFGIVHDQISYSVSSEYFTKFKFIQFGLGDAFLSERVRAGLVGFLASWWMGIPLGVLCGAAGFMQRTPALMGRALLWSLPLIAAFTLAIALAGLAYGWLQTAAIERESLAAHTVVGIGWFIPPGVENLRRFLCAGYMHNAAYLGGALSIPAAWLFHFVFRAQTSIPG